MRLALEKATHQEKEEVRPVVYIENNSGETIYFEQGGGDLPSFGQASLVHYESNREYIAHAREAGGSIEPSPFGPSEKGLPSGEAMRLEMVDRSSFDSLRRECPGDEVIALTSFYTSPDRCWLLWSDRLRFE